MASGQPEPERVSVPQWLGGDCLVSLLPPHNIWLAVGGLRVESAGET